MKKKNIERFKNIIQNLCFFYVLAVSILNICLIKKITIIMKEIPTWFKTEVMIVFIIGLILIALNSYTIGYDDGQKDQKKGTY